MRKLHGYVVIKSVLKSAEKYMLFVRGGADFCRIFNDDGTLQRDSRRWFYGLIKSILVCKRGSKKFSHVVPSVLSKSENTPKVFNHI
jgi:hypothetical protein